MTHPDEPGKIFQSPTSPKVEEQAKPAVDGSDEAMRRLRHPFETSRTEDVDHQPERPAPDQP